MSGASKMLIFGGIAIAAIGMLYGLHYAIFVEHQTLESMGGSLAEAFVRAAERNLPEAHTAIDAYGAANYDYVRQVDVHSHWGGLAMLMIVLGVVFDSLAFSDRMRFWIALALLVGSPRLPCLLVPPWNWQAGSSPLDAQLDQADSLQRELPVAQADWLA